MNFSFKKLSGILVFIPLLITPVSCGNKNANQKIKVVIHAKKGWAPYDNNTFEKNLEKELDNQFHVIFDSDYGDDNIVMNNVISSKADLGFSSITQINLSKKKKDKFIPKFKH